MAISYRSTRSTAASESVSFAEALLRGLAPDGGLYVPAALPRTPFSQLFRENAFPDGARRAFAEWIGDEIPAPDQERIVRDALNFPVPLVPLDSSGGGPWRDVFVLELFHGPTLSFKDLGARVMARWMGYFLEMRDERATILVATSGDTGSAVADGFAGQGRIRVALLYPGGKVSPVQERQLIAARPGVQALRVAGDFDDCQRMVKEAFAHPAYAEARLSSANSINIGRLLPQMTYYAQAASHFPGKKPWFCVPSGNLGNLTGGIFAHLSGLPAAGFLAAHNANDFFPRYLSSETAEFAPVIRTLSNAMDVGAPSNFERLQALLDRRAMRRLICAERVLDEDTSASMRRVYEATGYVADPHTAVGLEAVRRRRARGEMQGPVVALATAHPAKFPETVRAALGFEPDVPPRLAAIGAQGESVEEAAPSAEALRPYLVGS